MSFDSELPEVMEEIAAHAGREAALALSAACGGKRFWMPAHGRLPDDHPFVQAIGKTAAERIAAAMASTEVYVPVHAKTLRLYRAITDDYIARVPVAQIADKHNVSRPTVFAALRRLGISPGGRK